MSPATDTCNEVLKALRKIIRAIDINSKKISKLYDLTGPQLLIIKDLHEGGSCPVGNLAKRVSLSHATVTEIVVRLEKKGYLKRVKSSEDKRKILVHLEEKALEILKQKPTVIQERFESEFLQLPNWEQSMILSNFQKVAHLMDADSIDAAPFLVNTSSVTGGLK